MENEKVGMTIKDLMFSNDICKSTVHGWIWYCDECQTHGNADSADEADHMGEAHYDFMLIAQNSLDSEEDEGLDGELSEPACEGAIYILDVDNAITYNHGDDYSDKTPNLLPDNLDDAINARKFLGLAPQDEPEQSEEDGTE